MKIVIDTTVFCQGFNSRSANVRLLKSFLQRTSAELCVSVVVFEEAVNQVRKNIDDANRKLNDVLRLTGDAKSYSKLHVENGLAKFRESLSALLKELDARVLDYPAVRHEDLF